MSDADDRLIQKSRADAIRRARDRRNATVSGDTDDASATDESTSQADSASVSEPNYVDFVDRKMRERKKSDEPT